MLRAAMLFALSTTNKFGLAGTGAAFILFSLVSAMVVPRMNMNFPGRALKVYLVICVAFFVAMISAVLIFGKEKKKALAATSTPSATTTAPAAVTGNAAAGKVIFNTTGGCGACHTFAAAGSTGTVGPHLDMLAPAAKAANEALVPFVRQSIVDPNAVIATGFTAGVMPPNFGTSLTKAQIDDLVAFLVKGQK
jgi:mono/diheme cytochrome c family protein